VNVGERSYDDCENVTEILTFGKEWLKKNYRKIKYDLSSEYLNLLSS
jgi:hypothetical protein